MLAELDAPVLDLRSGAYAAFGRVPGAITARVVTRQPDGRLTVVSHFNKATKGRLARVVATAPREPSSLRSVDVRVRDRLPVGDVGGCHLE
jgi:cytoplasmic iron level regulating protein YaaA (DUF328/UPF0246 family)